jgi:hypothetical protein
MTPTAIFERRLAQANAIFACLGLGLGVFFLMHGVRLGFLESFMLSVFLCAFFPMNAILSVSSYGIVCQTIFLLSTLLFPVLVAYDFINATYINPDPQSGLVLLLGPGYSILMVPFWLVALWLSSRRENCAILLPKSWYSCPETPLDDQWIRTDNITSRPTTDVTPESEDA